MDPLALLLAAFVLALALTGLVRAYALRVGLLDRPGARSSHRAPTPRGGGLAIVAAFASGVCALAWSAWLPWQTVQAVLAGGLVVAAAGLIDDHRPLPAWLRLLAHLAAGAAALAWVGGVPAVALAGAPLDFGWAGFALAIVGLAWLTNLYNFMDGIDGLAAAEAIFAASMGALLAWAGGRTGLALGSAVLAVAAAGFFVWNRPPARIFMGDVGSGFLGMTFGLLALVAAAESGPGIAVWLILLAVFVADATVTLLRRMVRGERWYAAHRSHAYQRLARRWGGHGRVVLAATAVNLLWLAPLAAAAWAWPAWDLAFLALAYAPIVGAALHLGAGLPD
jgi:Fuc2NAc and GlcNAc transferase